MPLDAQVEAVMRARDALGNPPRNQQTPEQARALSESAPLPQGPEVARVEDRTVPGPGGDIPVRVYTPPGDGPFPGLAYFHGGGWVIGSIRNSDPTVRRLTVGGGCLTVSVDYRLAPEHKFPAAAEDCYAVTAWMAGNAAALNLDASRLAVTGGSAGGNRAAVVALMARDRGGPALIHQALVYPVIERDYTTKSYLDNGDGPLLTRAGMQWFWNHYMRSDADAEHPYAAPIKADDLSGLPPAHVVTAEYDPLRDEGAAYAERLRQAGVPTVHKDYPGMVHGFFNMWHVVDKADKAVEDVCRELRRAFAA